MNNKKILIDFDGTVHRANNGYGDGTIYDIPNERAVFTITNWTKQGYKVIIFTARDEKEFPAIKEWLKKWKFPDLEITNRKMPALVYIDNRAIRFTSFADMYSYFI